MGLVVCIILLAVILNKVFKIYIQVPSRQYKVLIGMIAGTFLRMLVQSIFEAWWTSPGSYENMYIWILLGVTRGLEIIMFHTKSNDR